MAPFGHRCSEQEGTQTIDVGTRHSNRLKSTPDGRLVLISDLGSGEVVFVEAASRKIVKRLSVGKNAEGIVIQPDGTRAFVAAADDNAVVVVDLKSLEISGKDCDRQRRPTAWRGRCGDRYPAQPPEV